MCWAQWESEFGVSYVWVAWHLADWCYYQCLPSLYLEHLVRIFFFASPVLVHSCALLQACFRAGATRLCVQPAHVCSDSLSCRALAALRLRACLTFHNCIITRSVSSREKWAHHNLQHMLGADTCPWLWTWVECLPHQVVLIHPSMWADTCCCGWIKWLDGNQFPGPSFPRQPEWIYPSERWVWGLPVTPLIHWRGFGLICLLVSPSDILGASRPKPQGTKSQLQQLWGMDRKKSNTSRTVLHIQFSYWFDRPITIAH